MAQAKTRTADWRMMAAGALVLLGAAGCTPGPWGPGGGAGGGGGGTGDGPVAQPGAPIDPSATPELGSLVLFGSGAAGFAGYAWTRLRAGRPGKRDDAPDAAA